MHEQRSGVSVCAGKCHHRRMKGSFGAVWVGVVWWWSLVSMVHCQTRLCQNYTPTLDGGQCTTQHSVCEFKLVVDNKLTMTKDDGTGLLVQDYTIRRSQNGPALNESELADVVFGDGWSKNRLVTVVNGTLPGPCLTFFKDQTVKIHVVNNLPSESLTIHWHGLDMFKNSYYDGVAFVSQCPIQPGESFVYTVSARQPGSYWYHSHIGAQRSMGILGPLVVLPRGETLPRNERVMILQDWNHDLTSDSIELGTYEVVDGKPEPRGPTHSLDNARFSAYPFQSGLINGRGRYYTKTTPPVTIQTRTPLEVYEVEMNQTYRFRVIGAGTIYPFRVSVQDHRITMVATDGHDFEPVPAESFVINPGERFDFILKANGSAGNYMILAETLEVTLPGQVRHVAEAVLHYTGAPSWTGLLNTPYLPTNGQARGCRSSQPCTVVNCPFSYYPMGDYTQCLNLGDLKAPGPMDVTQAPDDDNASQIHQIFLNYAFPGTTKTPAAINGIQFERPPVAAILYPGGQLERVPTKCEARCGEENQQCYCTHTVVLQQNRVHQLVLIDMGSGKGFSHPVHIHGYSFYVVKMGYPVYNRNTGVLTGENQDVKCVDDFCNVARWRNTSWTPGNVPGLNLLNPIRKDTIIVPDGGYVIVRLRADNPGMWFVHCHIELHHLSGMALILDGSRTADGKNALSPPPHGFPTCDNFPKSPGLPRLSTDGGASSHSHPCTVVWTFVTLCLLPMLY